MPSCRHGGAAWEHDQASLHACNTTNQEGSWNACYNGEMVAPTWKMDAKVDPSSRACHRPASSAGVLAALS